MEFLRWTEIKDDRHAIDAAFLRLLADGLLVQRQESLQWCFLRSCYDVWTPEPRTDLLRDQVRTTRLAQYRYEVENKLARYYRRYGKAVDFVFAVDHERNAPVQGDYPSYRGYLLRVRRRRPDGIARDDELLQRAEAVVGRALEAEMQCYLDPTDTRILELKNYYVPDGPAYRQILNVVEGIRAREWTLTTPAFNPSTFRLVRCEAKFERVPVGDGRELRVSTDEYWYLRWWDLRREKYVYPYRETNRQLYFLETDATAMRIHTNSYPAPRTSAPHRRR